VRPFGIGCTSSLHNQFVVDRASADASWERWDGQKPDGTLQDRGMNSFNHYAYGAVGDWIYRVAAGIEIDEMAR
jgi:Bacterial alpha-L-rhamnosidase 6 hairpin glycosidase domain